MALTQAWRLRIEAWRDALERLCYQPVNDVRLALAIAEQDVTPARARRLAFRPVDTGQPWGEPWQYGWFRGRARVPKQLAGRRVMLAFDAPDSFSGGGEAVVYVDGVAAGAKDRHHQQLTLTRRAAGGESFGFLAEWYAGHGRTPVHTGPVAYNAEPVPRPRGEFAERLGDLQRTVPAASVGYWREDCFQAWLDLVTLYELRDQLLPDSLRVADIDAALRQFTLVTDLELDEQPMLASVRAGRKVLAPALACINGSTAPVMRCFGHAHIDTAWLWPLRETESKCLRTFANQLALMEEYPEYQFLQSQPHLYRMTEARDPALYQRIKAAVAAGRWLPEGAMWIEPDTNIPSGESLIRQALHGKRFFREEFGVESRLMWLPDVFGYSGSLPQILKGCGIDWFSTHKLLWVYSGNDPFPYTTFNWEGIDGTSVVAHIHRNYNAETRPSFTFEIWSSRSQKDGVREHLMPVGHGDGGGGATREHLEFIRRQRDLEDAPRTVISSPAPLFEDAERRRDQLPTYVGELYFSEHRGTLTSQARTKRGNRRSEWALREAELWTLAAAAPSGAAKGTTYPRQELDALWKTVLLNQFHDIIPGSSIARVYAEAEADYDRVIAAADRLAGAARQRLTTGGKRGTVTVFNSLGWEREEVVRLQGSARGLVDPGGAAAAAQEVEGGRYALVRVPSYGWTTLRPGSTAAPLDLNAASRAAVKASRTRIENEHLRLTIDRFGRLAAIVDKSTGTDWAATPCNELRMYKDVPNRFDAWDIDVMYRETPVPLTARATVTVVASGPLLAAVRVERTIGSSTLVQEIRLAAGSRRVDFHTRIDWRERHRLLKVAFPVTVHSNEALHEIQFGHLTRPTHTNRAHDADRFEVSQQKWTALAEPGRGAAVLNDCKYGISVDGHSMELTLLKSATAPDPKADAGIQELTYSLFTWNGSFADANVVREAYQLNCPLTTASGAADPRSLLSVDAANVVIETVKAAEDGSGDTVVRLYESKRMATSCTLGTTLPVRRCLRTNMLEADGVELPLADSRVALELRPFEILTLRLCR